MCSHIVQECLATHLFYHSTEQGPAVGSVVVLTWGTRDSRGGARGG